MFTAQELADLATGARTLAYQARLDAQRNDDPAIRSTFEHTESTYRELAAKCERLAWTDQAPDAVQGLPVYWQPP